MRLRCGDDLNGGLFLLFSFSLLAEQVCFGTLKLLEFLCQRCVPLGKHIDGVNTFLQILVDIFLLKLELGALDSNCFQQNVNILLPFILGA